jgi:S1-C subfamily serine protease
MTDHKDIWLRGWGKEVDFNLFPTAEALEKANNNGTDNNSVFGNPLFVNPEKGDFSVEERSPALKLGFKNFAMEGFGVKNEKLKKIAKNPIIPKLHIAEFQKEKVKSRNWLGADIKNVETLGERSAAGLEKGEGVLVMSINSGSLAEKAGLKKGDVIIKCEDTVTIKMSDLLSSYQGNNWKGQLKLIVYRNQSEREIQISTK